MFLVIVNLILLIGGQFMEPSGLHRSSSRPWSSPSPSSLGIDPIHLGIIMVVNMEIGMITPPVGLNLFVTSGVAGDAHDERVVCARPCRGWASCSIFLVLVTYVPWISTWIPTALMGPEIITR